MGFASNGNVCIEDYAGGVSSYKYHRPVPKAVKTEILVDTIQLAKALKKNTIVLFEGSDVAMSNEYYKKLMSVINAVAKIPE